jgi:hypothetical protein
MDERERMRGNESEEETGAGTGDVVHTKTESALQA